MDERRTSTKRLTVWLFRKQSAMTKANARHRPADPLNHCVESQLVQKARDTDTPCGHNLRARKNKAIQFRISLRRFNLRLVSAIFTSSGSLTAEASDQVERPNMKRQTPPCICIALASLSSLLCIPCAAQSACPWLNAATASGVLGGPTTVEVNHSAAGAGSCLFQLPGGSPNSVLRIIVIQIDDADIAKVKMESYEAGCTSPPVPLKALGTGAVHCVTNQKALPGELVVGRVRNNIFTVAMSTQPAGPPESTRDSLAEKAQVIAEQIAGSLF